MTKLPLFALLLPLMGCSEKVDHAFSVGDMVTAKVSGQCGMVVGYWDNKFKYRIRFGGVGTKTIPSGLFSSETVADPYPKVDMYEYELSRGCNND